jgi:hypothetical protein
LVIDVSKEDAMTDNTRDLQKEYEDLKTKTDNWYLKEVTYKEVPLNEEQLQQAVKEARMKRRERVTQGSLHL